MLMVLMLVLELSLKYLQRKYSLFVVNFNIGNMRFETYTSSAIKSLSHM